MNVILNIFKVNLKTMMNRNEAEYTNFDGKTNKKIVQAPGGASSFSLAWSNDPTDYGQDRKIKKSKKDLGGPNQYQGYGTPKIDYSEPMRVMEPTNNYPPQYSGQSQQYSGQQHSAQYSGHQQSSNQYNNSYDNYNKGSSEYSRQQSYKNIQKPPSYYNNQVDQIDIAMQQHEKQRPPSVPRLPPSQNKPSIKINCPSSNNFIIGDNYNYWKDDGKQQPPIRGQNNRPNSQIPRGNQPTFGQRVPPQQYTIHNPPGGKQNFTLG